ncbi:MAG: DUF3135 domain-containing protein [Burkholderiales bacterium]|jgi:hypothetical protein|nr:DUF3135 domain-containing protein [Burkholderiales bacterium]
MTDFDFAQWAQLHQEDPVAFDQKREEALREFIDSARPDSRLMLEQTLFTLQMHRRKAKSGLQSAIFASNLMWESFGKMRESMNEARSVFQEAEPVLRMVSSDNLDKVDDIIHRWAVTPSGAPVAEQERETESIAPANQTASNVIAFRPRG